MYEISNMEKKVLKKNFSSIEKTKFKKCLNHMLKNEPLENWNDETLFKLMSKYPFLKS